MRFYAGGAIGFSVTKECQWLTCRDDHNVMVNLSHQSVIFWTVFTNMIKDSPLPCILQAGVLSCFYPSIGNVTNGVNTVLKAILE